MTDVIKRAIRIAEEASTEFGDAEGYVQTDEEAQSLSKKSDEATKVADALGRLRLLELLEEVFEHLRDDIEAREDYQKSARLGGKVAKTLRAAGYFDGHESERLG